MYTNKRFIVTDCKKNLYKNRDVITAIVTIGKCKLPCLFISHNELSILIQGVAFNLKEAFLIGRQTDEYDYLIDEYLMSEYKICSEIKWDHLIYSPETFLRINDYIHYSEKDMSTIYPCTLNVGNKISGINAASFWTMRNNYYSSCIYGEKTYIANIVFHFFRRLVKKVYVGCNSIIVAPEKNIRIYIEKDFYEMHKAELMDFSIYEYHYKTFGFSSSLGCEYAVKEYTFSENIVPDCRNELFLRDFIRYVKVLSREDFDAVKQEIASMYIRKHFCDWINVKKPSFYYEYDEIIQRRKEIDMQVNRQSFQFYCPIMEYIPDECDIRNNLFITSDLHLGKKSGSLKELKKEIVEFWDLQHIYGDYLLLLGDIIDADYLSIDEYKLATTFFLSFAPKWTGLIVGNNDMCIDEKEYEKCGYAFAKTDMIFGRFVFTHMPVSTDGCVINIHGHLHGRNNYLNMSPVNHIDIGYKANKYMIYTLGRYLERGIDLSTKKCQELDVEELFDYKTLSLFKSYRTMYTIADCFK